MTSAEFARWAAYLQIEPSIEYRADFLAGALGALIGRVEATLGGKPPKLGTRLIQWDRTETDDQETMAAWLGSLNNGGKRTSNDDRKRARRGRHDAGAGAGDALG
jgi:hypothetical protein